jgi:ubiquinone/menaquinone biosynthesis C-methylase UbiE
VEFTKIAIDYDKGRSGEDVEFWAKETKRLANLDHGSLILDLGCGTGIYTLGIGEATSAVMCGLDPSKGMLRQAVTKTKNVHWFNGVGDKLPLRSDLFDCLFSSQVWHHIEERQATADECGRALRDGGSVVIRTISHEQLLRKVVFSFFPEILSNQLRVYPSNEDFEGYFEEANFTSIVFHSYELERYQEPSSFIEIAQKKLWSMFRPITEKGLKQGVDKLIKYSKENPGIPIRNDESITLVVSQK